VSPRLDEPQQSDADPYEHSWHGNLLAALPGGLHDVGLSPAAAAMVLISDESASRIAWDETRLHATRLLVM